MLADPKLRERYDRYGPEFRSVPEDMDERFAGAGAAPASRRRPAAGSAGRGAGWPGQAGPSEYARAGRSTSRSCSATCSAAAGRRGAWIAGADQEAELVLSVEEAYRGGRRRISLGPRELRRDHPGRRRRRPADPARRARAAGVAAGRPATSTWWCGSPPHPRFRLSGRDITVDLPVAAWEAALGATVPVSTPGGEATVTVPAGSSSGRRLRLRGQGMPNPRGTPGDLYAEVKIMVPDRLSERERELFEELSQVSSFDPRRSR